MIGDREVDPAAPLGEQGLGLDSLALVKFMTAVENHFAVELPEETWIDRQALTLTRLEEIIEEAAGSVAAKESIEIASAEPVKTAGALRRAKQILRLAAGLVYRNTTFHILVYDLKRPSGHNHEPAAAVNFRTAGPDDLNEAVAMWPNRKRRRKHRTFASRVAAGYACYVAEIAGKIAAIDWVTATEDRERNLGLVIRPRPGSCYGLDLYEHPDWEEKGIGLALLLYCLRQSAAQGYQRQYTIVQSSNRKMLVTSIQLIGFVSAGKIRARRVLGFPLPTWRVDGAVGRGRELIL